MIEAGVGDLFACNVDALVNAVNSVGVMGKGLALAFKKKFPDNFDAYRRACKAGSVRIGEMLVFDRSPATPRWIINFPTKRHWREASRLDDLRAGLTSFVEQVRDRAIESVAMPAIGCGLGGASWDEVRPLIENACSAIPETRIVLFAPRSAAR